MKATVPAVLALLAAAPALSQTPRQVTQPPPANSPASVFPLECVAIPRIIAASTSFSFQCQKADGTNVTVTVAKSVDGTGTYPVGHEPQTTAALSDAAQLAAVAAAVNAFVALKSAQPSSKSVLDLNGISSKLPAANGAPVVTTATVIVK